MQENALADRSPAADAARRHHARPPRAGRRDFPPHAVRRPRSRARDGQARAPRAAGADHRDRQVPDRADDGSGAAPGAQRRQPRHRDRRTNAVAAGKRPEGTITLSASTAGDIVTHRDRRRWPRHRCGGGGRARAREPGCRCRRARPTRRRCSRCSARPGSRRATSPIAPAAAASAWRVVQTAVEELSGTLRLETEPGTGTRFVDRAAGDAGDHRRAHRAGRRPRRSPCRRARSAR